MGMFLMDVAHEPTWTYLRRSDTSDRSKNIPMPAPLLGDLIDVNGHLLLTEQHGAFVDADFGDGAQLGIVDVANAIAA